ncbi:hypothetical protein LIA77_09711 [Sarocladium implicatum]|nr:hypothetical protein LIA77_09711 [Sarocladium implicatum]
MPGAVLLGLEERRKRMMQTAGRNGVLQRSSSRWMVDVSREEYEDTRLMMEAQVGEGREMGGRGTPQHILSPESGCRTAASGANRDKGPPNWGALWRGKSPIGSGQGGTVGRTPHFGDSSCLLSASHANRPSHGVDAIAAEECKVHVEEFGNRWAKAMTVSQMVPGWCVMHFPGVTSQMA